MLTLVSILNENKHLGKTFVSVDIQPEYEKAFGFGIEDYCSFLNELESDKLVFLYNGYDTLDMIRKEDYRYWFLENGLSEEVLDTARFYDKGYAFFRYCMDNSLEDETVANFVRFMYNNDVRDSRDMTRDMWAKYLREYRLRDRKVVYELLRDSGDCVHIPDLMDYVKQLNNIVLTGGGVNECLKEVEIALMALNKPYQVEHKFTY